MALTNPSSQPAAAGDDLMTEIVRDEGDRVIARFSVCESAVAEFGG
jgi:hypothetical protein